MSITKRAISFLLAFILGATAAVSIPVAAVKAAPRETTFDDWYYSDIQPEITNSYCISDGSESESFEDVPELVPDIPPEKQLLRGDMIRISNLMQLLAIGTDAAVTDSDLFEASFGTGEPVCYEDGTPARYSGSASYYIENDIPLGDTLFRLPEGFSGSFMGVPKRGDSKVYDGGTDTVYIGSIYQLAAIASDNREELPVISGDISGDTFGLGRFIFPADGEGFVTYSAEHRYVLSSEFTSRSGSSSALLSSARAADHSDLINGRDYFGQVTVTIDGTEYILIGDRQQLDAINSNDEDRIKVSGPVYEVTQTRVWEGGPVTGGYTEWTTQSTKLVYPGDADLVAGVYPEDSHTDTDFSWPNRAVNIMFDRDALLDINRRYPRLSSDLSGSTGTSRTVYCTVNANGEPDVNERDFSTSLKYEKHGDYIVFRDINMYSEEADSTWLPLMFTGIMLGAKVDSTDPTAKLWSDNAGTLSLNVDTSLKPTIYNFTVKPDASTETTVEYGTQNSMNVATHMGVGFFGTLTGYMTEASFFGELCKVSNIRLYDGTVDNDATKAMADISLVNGLLTAVATLLQTVLNPLLSGLLNKPVNLNLMDLLNTRAADPTSLATGGFAGRIIGNVLVEDCEVENVDVKAVKTIFEDDDRDGDILEDDGKIVGFGGFVGHVEGVTKYEGLSDLLKQVVKTLAGALNIIPGLGLGDLINLLLGNVLNVGDLIPTGYLSPNIDRSTVDNCTLSYNAADGYGKLGVGGFAGSVVGSIITESKVENSNMDVKAHLFAGGFAGVVRDGAYEGVIDKLNITAYTFVPLQSELVKCSIINCIMTVEAAYYTGGFAGVLANSYIINGTIDASSDMDAEGIYDYVGGFVGYARLGTLVGLGTYVKAKTNLLSTVSGLLSDVLANGTYTQNQKQTLLDLGGVAPSAILGCEILCPLSVSSSDGGFVGGIVGRGDGVILAESDRTHIKNLTKYEREDDATVVLPITSSEARSKNRVTQAESFTAKTNYVGGIGGYLDPASVGGLLGGAAGLGQYLGFEAKNIEITGINDTVGYTVQADESYAGGGIGLAVGGDVWYVELDRLGSVRANNVAGGFVGVTGPGDLADSSGVSLSLLGLELLKIDNLLSLFSGVRTTYLKANVRGISSGYTVTETGTGTLPYTAGGYAAEANSVRIVDCHATNLLSVNANFYNGIAGGFVGRSAAGSIAKLVDTASTASDSEKPSFTLAQVGKLVDAIPTLVPSYDGCYVRYVSGGFVEGDAAGGFAGDFRSGKINTYTMEEVVISGTTYVGVNPIEDSSTPYTDYDYGTSTKPWSVLNIHHVRGGTYAGGWGGHVYPGALADAGNGLNLLGAVKLDSVLSADDLLGIADVYIPIIKYAGVDSYDGTTNMGFTVYASHDYGISGNSPATAGYAGGFIGLGESVQISWSSVRKLKHGAVTEPDALTSNDENAYAVIGIRPDALESENGSSYMSFQNTPDAIPYAVAGAYYAGGYIGLMDVGSTASIGDNLSLLGTGVDLDNVLGLLDCVVSTIEHSDVLGAPGGFNVIASSMIHRHNGSYDANGVSYAGGFAGKIAGGHIQDSNVDNFAYIIGEVAAGGYVGEMISGSVANVLDNSSVLGILDTTKLGNLASLVSDFVPTIRNSQTTCIPCGGAVRAEKASDASTMRGMAGGYVGHSVGGQIWGLSTAIWKTEDPYSPPTGRQNRECGAIRIRSVYGAEYAGGYCGLVEAGDQASVGGADLLGGLLNASNTLSAVKATYPTIKEAYVNGPLRDIDEDTWNAWKVYIGEYGAFAPELAGASYTDLANFIYGTHVVAGRHTYNNDTLRKISGCAGGFVGAMHSGVIRDSEALDTKLVLGMRSAGGFAGEMRTGNLASLGGLSAASIAVNLGNIVSNLGSFLVPAITDSGTEAYGHGLTVGSYGDPANPDEGMAGGYVGGAYGAQIDGAWVRKLKLVKGTNAIGGFVGKGAAAALLNANTTEASDPDGLLQKVLDWLLQNANNYSNFANVLQATVCTIKDTEVVSLENDYGFVVDGSYRMSGTKYARYAGGYAGLLESTVINKRDDTSVKATVGKLRGVSGGHYAGGFVGSASVGSVASVGGSHTNILNLLNLGNVGLLDIFRTYIYNAELHGVNDGICVYAHDYEILGGELQNRMVSGAAGGFAGGLLSATAFNCTVDNLNYIEAPHFAGGFFGHGGKKGVLDLSGLSVDGSSVLGTLLTTIGLDLSTSLQLLDCVGSTVKHCEASGFADGYIVKTTHPITDTYLGVEERFVYGSCAGGFGGYADLTHIEDLDGNHCTVTKLKKVESPQVAGGFIARSSAAYLADLNVSSDLVGAITWLLNILLKALLVQDLENIGLLDIQTRLLGIELLNGGNLAKLNLFGLEISLAVASTDPVTGKPSAVTVTLGSSTITLPVGTDGNVDTTNLDVNLIQVNRTDVKNATVTGVPYGYDVFGGGATQTADGTDSLGYAGGFVGYNNNGFFSHDTMELCDVVRGTDGKVGPFSGCILTRSGSYPPEYFEDNGNIYYIYRGYDSGLTGAYTASDTQFASAADYTEPESGEHYNRYQVDHYDTIVSHADLMNANEKGGAATRVLEAYVSGAKAKLMLDTPMGNNDPGDSTQPNDGKDPCEDRIDLTINKIWQDHNNAAGERPTEFTVKVLKVDYGTSVPTNLIEVGYPALPIMEEFTVVLRESENADPWSNTWRYTLQNLPIAYMAPVTPANPGDPTEELHYIVYYVYEPSLIPHYTANYTIVQDTATVTITNIYHDLPDTGGRGTTPYMLAGILLLTVGAVLAVYIYPRRERRRRKSSAR